MTRARRLSSCQGVAPIHPGCMSVEELAGSSSASPLTLHLIEGSSLAQHMNGWCTCSCEGWRQYRYAIPAAGYDLVKPEEGKLLGKVDDLGEGRVSMIWLIDGSTHLISDYWRSKDLTGGSKKLLVVGAFELVRNNCVWGTQISEANFISVKRCLPTPPLV